MKNFRTILPAILLTGIFIYSCNADHAPYDGGQAYESKKTDSISSTSYAYSPPSGNEKNRSVSGNADGSFNNKPLGASKVSSNDIPNDQTENNNNEFQQFLYLMQSNVARPTKLDSTHRFIRTADIRFKVKNVASTSYKIENIVSRLGGYVADTKLNSQLISSDEKPVSIDSSLQTLRYLVSNTIVIRIPVENLDTTLKSFVQFIEYLDYRNVNTNDITLDLFANRLAQARIAKFNQRLAFNVDNKPNKLADAQTAEESMLHQQENSDNALIENLRKDDQVKYSTITLNIYQPQTIRQELIARERNIDEYEPGLGSKMASSLSTGWHGLQIIILGFISLWPLWLIGAGLYYVIRRVLKKNK